MKNPKISDFLRPFFNEKSRIAPGALRV